MTDIHSRWALDPIPEQIYAVIEWPWKVIGFWYRFAELGEDVNGNWDLGLTWVLFVGGDKGDGGGVDSANYKKYRWIK